MQNFTKCDTCAYVDSFLELGSATAEALDRAERYKKEKQKHLDYIEGARRRLQERAEYARNNPTKVLFINTDAMDQRKTAVPTVVRPAKEDNIGLAMPVRLMGSIVYGHFFYGLWCIPQWSSSSNITLTAITAAIKYVQERNAQDPQWASSKTHLPPKLQLQLDNTAKDNKNHFLLGYCGLLLAEGLFEEVEVFFLPVGHTHNEVDQVFSLISKAVAREGAFTVDDLKKTSSSAWGYHRTIGSDMKLNVRMDGAMDFRKLLPHKGGMKHAEPGAVPVVKSFYGLGSEQRGKGATRLLARRWAFSNLLCVTQSKEFRSQNESGIELVG